MSSNEFLGNEYIGAERANPSRRDSERDSHPLASLHQAVGNQAVARMLRREADDSTDIMAKHDVSQGSGVVRREEEPEEEEVMAKHDVSQGSGVVRREEEPEEEEVMAKHDVSQGSGVVRREEEPEEEEIMAKHDLAQRAPEVGLAGGAVSDGLSARIENQRGGGSPLDSGTRATMEDTLGVGLGGVRVHVGEESDQLNHAITAKAFTTGNDVFVRSDQWSPGSSSTQRLLAHELTHVAQQHTMSSAGGGMTVGSADSSEEHEADAVAEQVVSRSTSGDTEKESE
jgi:Domain of unknown function (DUF4157)